MNTQDIFSCVYLCAAILASGFMPERERRAAVVCAAALYPVWALYTMSWDARLSPSIWLNGMTGWHLKAAEIWTCLDLSGGMVALMVAWRFSWGRFLWATFFISTLAHCLRWQAGWIGNPLYYGVLDACFYAQGAVFLKLGGGPLVQHILRFANDVGRRRRRHPVRPVLSGASRLNAHG